MAEAPNLDCLVAFDKDWRILKYSFFHGKQGLGLIQVKRIASAEDMVHLRECISESFKIK
jgi:hypothetical protein